MATSDTEICNSAIVKVGGQRIASLDEESSTARLFKEQYPKQRDELLYSHPWKFALKSAKLAEVAQDADPIHPHKFALPADCLRVIETDAVTYEWFVEDGYLYTDRDDQPIIKYIYKCTDVSKFSPGFSELLASKLAADVSYSLVQNVALRTQLIQEYKDQLRYIRSYSAQEGSTTRLYADSWLNSRY